MKENVCVLVPKVAVQFSGYAVTTFPVGSYVTGNVIVLSELPPAVAREEQFPLQPVKDWPAEGVAVSVTLVPPGKAALQVAPQLIPLGEDVTVPLPLVETPRTIAMLSMTSFKIMVSLFEPNK